MDLTYGLIALVLGIIAVLVFNMSGKKNVRKTAGWLSIVLLAVGAFSFASPGTVPFLNSTVSAPTLSVGGGTDNSGGTTISTFQPTLTVLAKDKFGTTQISGTSYYQPSGKDVTTTAISNVNPGDVISFWVDNVTGYYWVKPTTQTMVAGVNRIQDDSWSNGTSTLTLRDAVTLSSVKNGVSNTSLGANALATIDFIYQGTAKKSALPFGGVLAIEYNNTISSVTCTGDGLLATNPYHLTYAVTSTQGTYRVFGLDSTYDDGTGSVKKITCQFQNGATSSTGGQYYLKIYPANYYITNAGDIALDTEKFSNQDTTKTGGVINLPNTNGYWG